MGSTFAPCKFRALDTQNKAYLMLLADFTHVEINPVHLLIAKKTNIDGIIIDIA